MIYYQFHDKEEYREFYEMYEFAMVNDNSRAYYENYQNAIKEWRKKKSVRTDSAFKKRKNKNIRDGMFLL